MQVYGFLGQGLLLQGHSSKGLMAEAGVGVSLEVNGAGLGSHGQSINNSTNTVRADPPSRLALVSQIV